MKIILIIARTVVNNSSNKQRISEMLRADIVRLRQILEKLFYTNSPEYNDQQNSNETDFFQIIHLRRADDYFRYARIRR